MKGSFFCAVLSRGGNSAAPCRGGLRQHRTIWQEHSAKDFASYESYKRAGILYVFPPFITARMGQKIGRRPQTQLCGDALNIRPRQLRFPRAFPRRTAARTHNARPYEKTGGGNVGAGFMPARGAVAIPGNFPPNAARYRRRHEGMPPYGAAGHCGAPCRGGLYIRPWGSCDFGGAFPGAYTMRPYIHAYNKLEYPSR